MIYWCLISECWPMRTEWLRSNLPDCLSRGASAVCGYKLTSCNISWDADNALGRLPCRKWIHGIQCLTAFVAFPPFNYWAKNMVFIFSEKGSRVSRKRNDLFVQNPQSFFVLTASSISRCLPHTLLNGYARYSPRSLKDCSPCRPIFVQWSRHVPVSLCSDRQLFYLSTWWE